MSEQIKEYITDAADYTDYDFHLDAFSGKDWKATFFVFKENNEVTPVSYSAAPADNTTPYEETQRAAPKILIDYATTRRAEVIAKAEGAAQ